LFIIALTATVLAFIQNMVMFSFGLKELAIFSFPLSFTGICLAEIISIWAGYFCVRKFLQARRSLALAGWVIIVLGAAELALPVSSFSMWTQQVQKKRALNQIEHVGTSVESLASDRNGIRFALTYTLKFPRTAHYLTFPASLGPQGNPVFGHYFTKVHPEYYDESYVFDAGKPYSFTVVFDTEGRQFAFSREKANIDICDSKDYFMACRIITIGLEDVPAALTAHPFPVLLEPAVAEDNVRDLTEKSIRLDGLRLDSAATKTGAPVRFSFVITNVGNKDVVIPESKFGNVISINYGWEAVSESAKTTKVIPGTMHLGNWVTAGTAQFTFVRKSVLTPRERVAFQDKMTPFEPLNPGEYKLHVFLFSRYSTETNRPVQELVQKFSVVP
jgi:hypothetical protein